jgi:tartrate-resistant acid phosphatase type 5
MDPLNLNRREILSGLTGATLAAAWPASQAAAAQTGLRFLAIGDWGRDGAAHQREVAQQMGAAATTLGARFVVSVGDNFYDTGVESANDPQWKTSFEDVYTAPSLQTPWYVALGNHDYRGVPQAQLDYALTSPRWRMPARYYKVSGADHGFADADLFILDTSPFVEKYRVIPSLLRDNVLGQDTAAQLAWLDGELARSTAPWKLVFGHHTVFSGGDHGDTDELVAQLKPILQRHGVQAYINGHDHDLQQIEVDGVTYICTGAGSETRPVKAVAGTKFCLSRSGFTSYELTADSLVVAFRDYLGAVVHRAVVLRTAQIPSVAA